MTVLILAGQRDLSVDAMVRELTTRDVDVVRLDLAWFPQHVSLAAHFHQGRWQGTLTTPQHRVDLDGVRSVWYRAPSKFDLPLMSPAHQHHAHTEAKLGLGGVLLSLPARWLNPPGAHADAGYKPVQLAAAARSGLSVVDTVITNSAPVVREFTHQAGAAGVVTDSTAGTSPEGVVRTRAVLPWRGHTAAHGSRH